jgi:hypothetical protein
VPKILTLQLQDKDGNAVGAAQAVSFEDAEWTLLTRFRQFSAEVAETPIMLEGRRVSTSLSFDFTTGAESHAVVVPPKPEIQALLHVMRPFVLQHEPTAFNRIVNILEKCIPDPRMRAVLERQKELFSGKNFQQQVKMTASSAPGTEAVLNSEETFQLWLNTHEYHRDEDKQAAMEELQALLPFDWLRAMFISMLFDRALAVINIANFIHFLETCQPGAGQKFRL